MKDNFDVDEFIMQGQIQIIDKIKDFYYDELPDGWSQHFVDEIRYFDDGFYTIRYNNTCKAGTMRKRVITNAYYTIRDDDACKAGAIIKRAITNACYTIRDGDACKA